MLGARIKAAATTNSTLVQAGQQFVVGYALYNTSAAAKYFKFYDKATAPTVGTDVPAFTVCIAANSQATFVPPGGIWFALGIGYGITGAAADSDTTATTAEDVHGVLLWR